ncbi:ferredoxin [Halopolyspora algeriensis]|uniref:Ferredoxin n=1 Tax=Halopolyspora algeriensis TaxID=1500506 RepID=A0A368VWJ2_9ACTN|nr:ferredoxin [Halopolyspora algeriensis]RCW44537.1 ferredoxin [Halopolyspora algeriensis]TQM55897.1 ferredoxin [Halopolyspora algeriensis]
MEVSVDPRLCEANGVCVGLAPGVFALDDEEMLRIRQPAEDSEELERVVKAVQLCPKGALEIRTPESEPNP